MPEDDELEKLKEKYKYEIASLKRTIEKFNFLRSWLITTSLASLAFVLTFLLQIRIQTELPEILLAQISVGFLMVSVVCALYTKFCYEASGTVADVKDFAALFPVFLELINKDEETPEKEKSDVRELVEAQIGRMDGLRSSESNFNPFAELWRLGATGLSLFVGIVSSCAYFWLYLF